jgi:hypothetical protein
MPQPITEAIQKFAFSNVFSDETSERLQFLTFDGRSCGKNVHRGSLTGVFPTGGFKQFVRDCDRVALRHNGRLKYSATRGRR